MALEIGDAAGGTGLAGKIADEMEAAVPRFDRAKSKKIINAIAKAVVEYFQTNAEVSVPDVTSGGDTATGTIG
jgi:hypothetical protein